MASENGVLLDQVLRPSPPMPARTLLAILGFVIFINAAIALYFVLRGAWPIAPFLGADVALLAWAFRASLNAARREERVTLTPSLLRVARRSASFSVCANDARSSGARKVPIFRPFPWLQTINWLQ